MPKIKLDEIEWFLDDDLDDDFDPYENSKLKRKRDVKRHLDDYLEYKYLKQENYDWYDERYQ
jgi:hypothetical protein